MFAARSESAPCPQAGVRGLQPERIAPLFADLNFQTLL